jgi:hypothetical protein
MTYIINEAEAGSPFEAMPTMNVLAEGAVEYAEVGSFTVFYDEKGEDVLSVKTDKIKTMRKQ